MKCFKDPFVTRFCQAYTMELEAEVAKLKEENEELRKKQGWVEDGDSESEEAVSPETIEKRNKILARHRELLSSTMVHMHLSQHVTCVCEYKLILKIMYKDTFSADDFVGQATPRRSLMKKLEDRRREIIEELSNL